MQQNDSRATAAAAGATATANSPTKAPLVICRDGCSKFRQLPQNNVAIGGTTTQLSSPSTSTAVERPDRTAAAFIEYLCTVAERITSPSLTATNAHTAKAGPLNNVIIILLVPR